jgi:DNA-binding CsgD family transcriptional regulator
MPDGVTARFLDNEFCHQDVNKFRDLAAARDPVSSLDAATRGDWSASRRYQAIMRPLGLGDELRAALRTRHSTWGFLCLHRAAGAAAFSVAEIGLVRAVAADLAEGLRRAELVQRATADASCDGPGIVTLEPDVTVAACTPAGQRRLAELAEADSPRSGPVPVAVLAVATALGGVHGEHHAPRLAARTASGRQVVLHASYLSGPEPRQVAVVIEPASRPELEPVIVAAYQLTPRESETLKLLLQGLPRKIIANRLGVTGHTVNDHVKSIFGKTGVSSRGELLAAVFRDHYQPPRPR